MEDQLKITTAD